MVIYDEDETMQCNVAFVFLDESNSGFMATLKYVGFFYIYTVFPRFSAPGRLLIQTVLEGALIRGGRLYEGGAYLKMLINEGALICTRIKLRKK